MTSDYKVTNAREAAFIARERVATEAKRPGLTLREIPRKTAGDQGSDPYNTSGSFDRKKNWARVGKR